MPPMALPDGFLDSIRARLTLSDVVGRKVVWDRRKSTPSKGDFWAPCPFHRERTPSFHVDDRKGVYYCFGCQAKGDLIGFVRETENLSFIEAVERLAAEAGLEMPQDRADPRAAERRDRRDRLVEAMEEAVRLYRRAFASPAGQAARDYAAGRGLDAAVLERFEIGHAPDSRTHLTAHFEARGRLEDAIAAGLAIRPEDGGAPYDRFRNRLMFPIRDGRGRCIAFGGRALSPAARAKYLNSPETDLFHKGRVLFNEGPARAAAAKTGRLIMAEGYMDVIALSAAGFAEAVAPLGTAITAEQLALAWRIAPEPVIALDGDAAGLRAAHALIDLALPSLAPGRSLAFCLMPEGQDPDDLIRAGGPGAMAAALERALPLVELLWRRETDGQPLDTPERRAALDARLRAALGRIADPSVRAHYAADLRRRRAALFRPRPQGGTVASGGGRGWTPRWQAPAGPMPDTRRSWLATAPDAAAVNGREAAILMLACAHPRAAAALEAEIEELPLTTPRLEALRAALLAALAAGEDPVTAARRDLGEDPVETLGRLAQVRALTQSGRTRSPEEARALIGEMIARHRALHGAREELSEAAREIADAEGEDWTHRVREAGCLPLSVDLGALKRGAEDTPQRADAVHRMLADAETGVYRKKKPRSPPSNR